MNAEEHIVDLDLPAGKRWEFLAYYSNEINELLQCYLNDFAGADFIFDSIETYKYELISADYLSEIECISSFSNFTSNQVLAANLYYDLLKFYFGCTAFAVSSGSNIYHARNLDWHTENNLLSTHSRIFNFQRNGQTIYKTVGWLGFIGALSGIKPGKFSLTLNAVLSNDAPKVALPISFLLRDVLNTAQSYEDARKILESTSIASDCLILLSGTSENEKIVIERTPTRFATRETNGRFIAVTNDYKKLTNNNSDESILQLTSCGRYDRTMELLTEKLPENEGDCLKVLKDDKVMMRITVQQMVFDNRTGAVQLVKTNRII